MKKSQPIPLQPNLFGLKAEDKLGTKIQTKEQYISSVWSFPGSGGDQIYRWYGTLPRLLIEQLLELYVTKKTDIILDPFMGTGTTLDVAIEKNLNAIGLDVNPLACLVTEAKIYGFKSNLDITKHINLVKSSSGKHTQKKNRFISLSEDSKYDYMRKWFREDTLSALLDLAWKISEVDIIDVQRIFFVAFSQVVRDVASVDPRCTHHLVTKIKPFIDPFPLWESKVLAIARIVRVDSSRPTKIAISQESAINYKGDQVNFAILHPPYLGVIHYHLIHRLATDLLDITNKASNSISLKKYNFGNEDLKANDVSTDRTDYYKIFVEKLAKSMKNIIADDGRCSVIIGDQRHKGHLRHPFTDFINHFEKEGFILEENFIWVLQNNGGMHVLRRGHFIDHNYVLVFHKEK